MPKVNRFRQGDFVYLSDAAPRKTKQIIGCRTRGEILFFKRGKGVAGVRFGIDTDISYVCLTSLRKG